MKKAILAVSLLVVAAPCWAIPIAATIDAQHTTTIVGYKEVTKKHNGWGGGFLHIFGHKKKHYRIPIYEEAKIDAPVSSVPESSTYAMILAGMGLIAWRVKRKEQ